MRNFNNTNFILIPTKTQTTYGFVFIAQIYSTNFVASFRLYLHFQINSLTIFARFKIPTYSIPTFSPKTMSANRVASNQV